MQETTTPIQFEILDREEVAEKVAALIKANYMVDMELICRDVDPNEGIPPAYQVVDHKGTE